MNACICLPSTLRDKKIIGVFGSPDGNHANDYMGFTLLGNAFEYVVLPYGD
jgi:hypothetical protein